MLPVGGGAGVEDVLFGREQRQAVGIKVDRSLAHDGKRFPDHSRSFSLSSRVPTVLGVGVSAGENSHSGKSEGLSRPRGGEKTRSKSMQVHAMWGFSS